jgi:hypothetical protein
MSDLMGKESWGHPRTTCIDRRNRFTFRIRCIDEMFQMARKPRYEVADPGEVQVFHVVQRCVRRNRTPAPPGLRCLTPFGEGGSVRLYCW